MRLFNLHLSTAYPRCATLVEASKGLQEQGLFTNKSEFHPAKQPNVTSAQRQNVKLNRRKIRDFQSLGRLRFGPGADVLRRGCCATGVPNEMRLERGGRTPDVATVAEASPGTDARRRRGVGRAPWRTPAAADFEAQPPSGVDWGASRKCTWNDGGGGPSSLWEGGEQ